MLTLHANAQTCFARALRRPAFLHACGNSVSTRTIWARQEPERRCVYATSVLGAGREEAVCRLGSASELWPSLNLSAP